MDYLYDISDDWFNDEEDVQNTEVDENWANNRCSVCERQLTKHADNSKSCDYCGYWEKI